ncbi:hypothetical protein JCM8097_000853 [Rhodosporidiobolus ruineniae]
MATYVSLPTDAPVSPSTTLLSCRLREHTRLFTCLAGLTFLAVLALSPSSGRQYAEDALGRWRSGHEGEPVIPEPLGAEVESGRAWVGTLEEDELRGWRWEAKPDSSLKSALEGLSDDGGHAARHDAAPKPWQGPGRFEHGDEEKYNELLSEWKTGRPVLHVEDGQWQEDYTRLHHEVIRGERKTRLLEYWCEDGQECGGLADRLLGMTSTFLLALLSDRAFIASWDHPVPLSLLFDSPAVDWSEPFFPSLPSLAPDDGGRPHHILWSNGTLGDVRETVSMHNFKPEQVDSLRLQLAGEKTSRLTEAPWVRLERPNRGIAINSTSNPSLAPQLSSLGLTTSTIYAQLVHYLFRPKLEALMFIHEYTSLFSLPSVFAIGIQVRTGDVYMRDSERDVVNTLVRHQYWFDCAAEVFDTFAKPGQRPLYFLISDSAVLRKSAIDAYPDRVVVTGLDQHHNELRDDSLKLLRTAESEPRTVGEMIAELHGLQNTVATSWIFEAMDFSLLSWHSGFGKIPTFIHAKPNRAIVLPRVYPDPERPDDHSAYIRSSVLSSARRPVRAAVLLRSISTQRVSDKQDILNDQRSRRPVSPFHVYQPQLLSTTSIFHRIAGVGLSAAFYGLFLSHAAAPFFGYSLDSATLLAAWADLPPWLQLSGKAALAGVVSYKTATGLRHLVWDAGKVLSLKDSYMMTYAGLAFVGLSTGGLLML